MAQNQYETAIPLVLPNNCTWNQQTGEYHINPNVTRETLDVIPKALEQLSRIKGPVCVVSIAGPCRLGKSYILSKALGTQNKVFRLGHTLDPETMGIWLWVVPDKVRDANGREFTLVLLDSEGTDATNTDASSDHRIFTLSVLLSSILIYNSAGVPKKSDLEQLDFIVKLSERIELQTGKKGTNDEKHFYEAFPYFIWLLRDVVLSLPEGYSDYKDYFLKKILNAKNMSSAGASRKAAESILGYFSGFDAFGLPPPSQDPKVVQNINDPSIQDRINPAFLRGIQDFKTRTLEPRLSPKRSIYEGETVTGEALAALVQLFVEALNTPGAVPNVQNIWDTYVHNKCSEVLAAAVKTYEQKMTSLVANKIPCDADVLRSAHDQAMEVCLEMFRTETFSLSSKSVDKYLKELTDKLETPFSEWMEKNKKETGESCKMLAKELKESILDPVLVRLRSPDGCKMDFDEIVAAYNEIERRYKEEVCGDRDTIALVFLNIHSKLSEEMTQNVDILTTLKNYDALLIKEKTEKAYVEREKERVEDEKKRLEKETRAKDNQLALLQEKQKEEIARLKEMFEKKTNDQREQLNNMMKANSVEQRQEREAALAGQKTLEDLIKSNQDLVLAKDRENKLIQEQMASKMEKGSSERKLIQETFQDQLKKDKEDARIRQNTQEELIKSNQDLALANDRDNKSFQQQMASQMEKEREAARMRDGDIQRLIQTIEVDKKKKRNSGCVVL